MRSALRRLCLGCTAAVLCCAVFSAVPLRAAAHELLPVELVEFLKTHPNITQRQLDDFLNTKPELTKGDAAYKQRLTDTVFAGKVGFWDNAASFIVLGIKHILGGTDHILFILSLMLTFVTMRQMLKSVTTFTVAHSITLILAGLNVVTLGSRPVEAMVALSIAVVAIGTVFFRRYKFFASLESKLSMIFLFGMFHGMGFAGLLKTLSIPAGEFIPSLLFFNLGIEIGQMGIIALILPFIIVFQHKSWYWRAIQILAALIGGAATYWFLQRVFLF